MLPVLMSPARAGTGPQSRAEGERDTPHRASPGTETAGQGQRFNHSRATGTHERERMLTINGAGRIGRDAETRQAGSGTVTSFSVACDGYKGEKVTTWIDCSMWGKRGESLAQHLTKGTQVAFSGRGLLEIYDKRDGGQGAKVTCDVQDITLMGGGRDGGAPASQGRAEPKGQASGGDGFSDDEIPF